MICIFWGIICYIFFLKWNQSSSPHIFIAGTSRSFPSNVSTSASNNCVNLIKLSEFGFEALFNGSILSQIQAAST